MLVPMSIVWMGNIPTLTQLAASGMAEEEISLECLWGVTANPSQALRSQDQGASSTQGSVQALPCQHHPRER